MYRQVIYSFFPLLLLLAGPSRCQAVVQYARLNGTITFTHAPMGSANVFLGNTTALSTFSTLTRQVMIAGIAARPNVNPLFTAPPQFLSLRVIGATNPTGSMGSIGISFTSNLRITSAALLTDLNYLVDIKFGPYLAVTTVIPDYLDDLASSIPAVFSAVTGFFGDIEEARAIPDPNSGPSPTRRPAAVPTRRPVSPTRRPAATPTRRPVSPTRSPVATRTQRPVAPTRRPVSAPTRRPAASPTRRPAAAPTRRPVSAPTRRPVSPTRRPVSTPTRRPVSPTRNPAASPNRPQTCLRYGNACGTNDSSCCSNHCMMGICQRATQRPAAARTQRPAAAPTRNPAASPNRPQTCLRYGDACGTFDSSCCSNFCMMGICQRAAQRPPATRTQRPAAAPTRNPAASPNRPQTCLRYGNACGTNDSSCCSNHCMMGICQRATQRPAAARTQRPAAAPTRNPAASPTKPRSCLRCGDACGSNKACCSNRCKSGICHRSWARTSRVDGNELYRRALVLEDEEHDEDEEQDENELTE